MANKNLLQYVQDHCQRTGLPRPASAYGSSDKQVSQMVGLLQEFCDDLTTRKWFADNTFPTGFTSVADDTQGTIITIAPYGFEGIVPNTFWNRTQQRRVDGNVDSREWQERKAANFTGTIPEYRVWLGSIYFNPIPTAGDFYAFEYYSSYFIRSNVDEKQSYWQADSDYFAPDQRLPLAYLRWRWKAEKGLDYTEEKTAYETMLEAKFGRDATPKAVRLDCVTRDAKPGIIVPSGSWPLP